LIDIVLVKSDPIMNQGYPRVPQIVKSLCKKYTVLALGWNRAGTSAEVEHDNNVLRLFNFNAPYASEPYGVILLLPLFPFFWLWVFINLCLYRPRCVHACDLASVLPCYLYKILFRKKIIFDILDRHSMVYVHKNRNIMFRMLYSIVSSLEEMFASKSDVLIAVSEKLFLTFKKNSKKRIAIMNCCEDRMSARTRSEIKPFQLLFTGHITRGRGLDTLIDIVKDLNDVELVIAVTNKKLLEKIRVNRTLLAKIQDSPNIRFEYLLDYDELVNFEANSGVAIAIYDLDLEPLFRYGMANKILEAMMCGIPVITNIASEIVNETGCGITVEFENPKQIRDAIIILRDNPDLKRRLGNNGRIAFLEKYNWNRMEEKLYKVYEDLLRG
jgi:glycosyltransferase involved in cell wall biosynthesis